MATFVRLSFLSCIIGLFTLTVSLPPGLAADDENLTASLIGIRNIYVNVKPIDNPIVTEAGIDESLIKELAEKQLRKAGIQLLSQEEYNRYKMTLRYPLALLEVRLTVHEIDGMDAAIADLRIRAEIISDFRIPSAPHLRLGLNLEILTVGQTTLPISLNRPSQICGTSGRANREVISARTLSADDGESFPTPGC